MSRKKSKKAERERKKKLILIISAVFLTAVILSFSGVVYAYVIIRELPSLDQFGSRKVSQSTKIYDRTGEILLYEIFGEEKRTIVPFEEIPDYVKQATLAAEDERFYHQPAFDIKAIVRALITNIREGRIAQGGSTITQQLVKNVFLSSEKTITRKIKELILAIELESKYSKKEIFSAYLNQIPYGSNAYGIEAASQTFFNKSVKKLTLAEAATLAGLPRAPTLYSPWRTSAGEPVNKELINRRNHILKRMRELGFISEEEMLAAESEIPNFAPPSLGSIKAPHFSIAVRNYLVNRYGEETATKGGLRVITTLDWELQQIAEEVVKKGAERNEELYGGKNAALLAQDPKTGQILAMVGSRDYFDKSVDGNFNVATQGLRQPGSALKPFAYLTAFKKGFHPKSVVFDVPTEFVAGNPNCPAIVTPASNRLEDCFNPDNFDGIFRGPVSLEEGLSQSINVPSVKILYLAGLDDVLKTLADFGITTLKERWRYGLSLVLGGGEVRLAELVGAYSTLAEEGVFHEQTMILKIEDSKGNILDEYQDKAKRVFDRDPVREINQILSDKNLRSGLFRDSLGLTLFPEREVALKTGTTNDYRDAWAIGYTPNLTVGVWAGNNNNDPMHQQGSSILAAVPIWSDFLNRAFLKSDFPKEIFSRPEGRPPGNKPMLNGESTFRPIIKGRVYPHVHSILYWVDKKNPLGPPPGNPSSDPQFMNWEGSVLYWASLNIPGFSDYNKPLPGNVDFSAVANEEIIVIKNISPENGSFISAPLIVRADIESSNDLKKVDIYFNRELIQSFTLNNKQYNLIYYIPRPLKPQNLIEIKITDTLGNQKSTPIIIFSSG